MDYIEFHIKITPINTIINDLLAVDLAEIGFESFSETEDGMLAYVSSALYNKEAIRKTIPAEMYGSILEFFEKDIPGQNWNETWEKNYFQPIVIGKDCVIHSSFHTNIPEAEFDILIDPKMAFGTGHHETTSLMLEELLKLDVKNKSFLDMGCGTAVLAILASMKGAVHVLGIDIDQWATNNALENIQMNNTSSIEILTGGAELLEHTRSFDVIFANINRNILLADMAAYTAKMHTGSLLFMSGFYQTDIPVIRQMAESLGLTYHGHSMKNNWVAVRFEKK
ncbi:MAG TPA: 50S ribosomal protein L11 methyltransferase [Bacteroidales bacterium]|nr:50S ribosomal protein L11 methyltransferase [Bacteroidales bacterium]